MKTKKVILAITIALGLLLSQIVSALAAAPEWTDKPELEDYKIGQRLILKVRDIFNNITEQEIQKFSFNGFTYENLNPKNPVLVNDTDVLTKQQILKDALAQHNQLEKQWAQAESRAPQQIDLNDLEEADYTIAVLDQDVAEFNADEVLTLKGQGSILITITESKTKIVYVYFLAAAQGLERLAGNNRVDTALAIAKATFKGKIRNVVLVTATNYPDALSGSVLAYRYDAPVLLVGSSQQDREKVLSYLTDTLDPTGTVYILGGSGAVPASMEQQVKEKGFSNIKRLGGADRYATAVKISGMLNAPQGTPVVIASGASFPDALSVSVSAAVNQYPLLLVDKDKMPETVKNELSRINPGKVFIIGLQGAISDNVTAEISQIAGLDETNIIRIGGVDRYQTSVEVAKYFNLNGRGAGIATGENFPDALAGSIYAARFKVPLLLVDHHLQESSKQYLKNKKPVQLTIFGGEQVVTGNIRDELAQILEQ